MGMHIPGYQEAQQLFQPADASEILNPIKGGKKIVAGIDQTIHPSTQSQAVNAITGIAQNVASMPPKAGNNGQVTFGRRDQPFGQQATGMSQYLAEQRNNDVQNGLNFGGQYFGRGDPQIAEIESAQRDRALNGLSTDEKAAYNDQAARGINQQLGTGLRQLRTMQATNGMRGAAAGGAAIPVLQQADTARATAASNLNVADLATRQKAMEDYKNTVTGEREGLLGTAFGEAGLGATDRANALQYTLGQNYISALSKGQVPMPSASSNSQPWWAF